MVRAYPYYVPSRLIEQQRVQLVLPAFTLAVPVWAGASGILAQFPINNTEPFSFRLPIGVFGENFIAAIRWMEETDIFVRFILFPHDDAVLYYPLYGGERIGANAVIEIWSVDSVNAPVLEDNFTFESSQFVFPTSEQGQCFSCCANPSESILLVMTEPSVLPPGNACNPFCGDLCNTEPPMPVCDCPIIVKDTVADLRTVLSTSLTPPVMAQTFGGAAAGDGDGKSWRWNFASVALDDGSPTTVAVLPDDLNAASPGRWEQLL